MASEREGGCTKATKEEVEEENEQTKNKYNIQLNVNATYNDNDLHIQYMNIYNTYILKYILINIYIYIKRCKTEQTTQYNINRIRIRRKKKQKIYKCFI